MNDIEQEKLCYERIMGHEISWQDVVNACDELIETFKRKMEQEPEHGQFWQERLALTMLKRQEAIIMQDQEILQAIGKICIRVLEKSEAGTNE